MQGLAFAEGSDGVWCVPIERLMMLMMMMMLPMLMCRLSNACFLCSSHLACCPA
jgi:hypothetical protein